MASSSFWPTFSNAQFPLNLFLSLSRTLTLDFLIQQQRRKEGMSESGRESLKKLQTKIFLCRLVIRNFKKSDDLQKFVEI
jgi:hypothetical protein